MDSNIQKLVERIHATEGMAVVAVAGAGTHAISWLLGVAGASRTVLEIRVPYASSSFVEFLGYEPEQFVSQDAAIDMARAAYRRAVHLREGNVPVIGVACTAAIATDRHKRGDHRCHIAAWTSSGVSAYSLTFAKGLRHRDGEDTLASLLVMRGLSEAIGIEFDLPLELAPEEHVEVSCVLYEDLIEALLAGHVDSVTVNPDGSMSADEPVSGGVLPGSFNPLHEGHEKMAEAASALLGADVSYELSVINVDKPPLEEQEIRRRVAQFAGKRPLVLTRVPVFYKKAQLLKSSAFVIGWDTAVRLVDPRYYEGSVSKMLLALEEMREVGCRFLVAGRVEDGLFKTLKDVPIPDGFQDMFIEIPESEFRIDISSTRLRMAGHTP